MEPLVSVVSPCYNGEKKVSLFLDSLLKQTYSNIELIIINDGSTDSTEQIILSYKKLFEKKGYKFIYLTQKNGGQDSALNKGLKYFSGKYLMWTDSDDILDEDNIKEKVLYFEEHIDCSLVYCNAVVVKAGDLEKPIKFWNKKLETNKDKFFKDILTANDVIYAGGAWMLRTEKFLAVRPNRNIEIEGFGQNWQMLLPMIYNFKVGKIEKYLFKYIIYKDSHSNKKKTYLNEYNYIKKQKNGLMHIFDNIKMADSDRKKYNVFVENLINYRLMCISLDNGDRHNFKLMYNFLHKRKYKFNVKDKLKIILFNLYLYKYVKMVKDKFYKDLL